MILAVSIDFPINSEPDIPFHCIAYDYSFADLDGLRYYLRGVPWWNLFCSMVECL